MLVYAFCLGLPIPFQHLQKVFFHCVRKRDANYIVLVFLLIVPVNVQSSEHPLLGLLQGALQVDDLPRGR
jgi:hypothetical protein